MTALSDAALAHLRSVAAGEGDEADQERYRLVELLDRGGMGLVYRAYDRQLGREVALKVVAAPRPTEAAAGRLGQEARIMARLEHPAIVPVHDAGELADGRTYYAMRLVHGERLDAYLATERPLGERLRIFERVLEAVAYAHSHGVIHRDLKPANVMVGPFGEVLVMDWGVAKLRGDDGPPSEARSPSADGPPGWTAHGTVLGTPGYMAPEQERGEAALADERADVYSLGALLATMLGPAPPRALAAVATKALASEPAARYPTVAELAAEVAQFRAGLAVAAYRESAWEWLWRFTLRHRVAILMLLAYLLMRAGLLFWRGH